MTTRRARDLQEPEPRRNSKLDPNLRTSISVTSVRIDLKVEDLIDDPIGCGFLLRFCIRQHNEENLNFIIEVNRLREVFFNIDTQKKIWTRSFEDIDAELIQSKLIQPEPIQVENSPEKDAPSLAGFLKEIFLSVGGKITIKWSELEMLVREAEERMASIYARFLSNDSPTQICLSQKLLQDTTHRMENIIVIIYSWFDTISLFL